jgi:uncharacterized membrane protein
MKKINNPFIRLWLIIGIVAGFAALIFFMTTYLRSTVLCDLDCARSNKVVLSLIVTALFGLFVGSITYYFVSEKKEKAITKAHKEIHKGALLTLNYLDFEEKKIMYCIINNSGEILQSEIPKKTKLSRVAVSRNISSLVQKEIITKKESGMTNKIILNDDLKDLYLNA